MKVYDFTQGEVIDIKKLLEERAPTSYGDYETIVGNIIKNVKAKGNSAVLEYTAEFDKVTLNQVTMKVTTEEIKKAYDLVDEKLIQVIKKAKDRVYAFHAKQKQYSWFDTEEDGSIMGQKITPLERVGVYVPGGKAVYTSSVIMDVVPALVAGVKEIIVTTPPDSNGDINPQILVAADICGIDTIYKMGGAQAIAALAFGTETLKKVDKIVGPGNIFVALAKKAVYGHVSIDSIAGPSEVLVIADETSNPKYIAADLLSQAEHDELASSVLITTSKTIATKVKEEIKRQTAYLKRKDIINASLNNYGVTIIVDHLKDAVAISNEIAPEHLEICTKNPFELIPYIKNAGAIFLGNYTPEPLGDYMAGPNHVLPTNATAKFFSPLSVDDFIKKSSITFFGREALMSLSDDVIYFAESEELDAHANSIKVRFEND